MRVTLTQPWATLIAMGEKKIETRDWGVGWRGDFAIHAGKTLGPVGGIGGLELICRRTEPFKSTLAGKQLPLGAVVAVAELIDCIPGDPDWSAELLIAFRERPNERAFGGYGPDRIAWMLGNVRPLPTPVTVSGAQKIWTLPEDVAEAVRVQL